MGAFERRLAASGGVQKAVHAAADEIGARARALLAAHRQTGNASIKVDHSGIDSEVILDDPASLSIEFGRGGFTRKDGQYVGPAEGLHILARSI
jgi:uncharacterized protein DUF5403